MLRIRILCLERCLIRCVKTGTAKVIRDKYNDIEIELWYGNHDY